MSTRSRLMFAVILIVVLVSASAWQGTYADDTLIEIGSWLELFVDNYLIDRLDGTSLKLHSPIPQNVAIRFDKPWDGEFVGYITVIKDGDTFRLYYRGYPEATKKQVYCYAESKDGINFTKPNLRLFEINGSKNNNVILTEGTATHNLSPFLDSRPGVPASERFKALGGSSKSGLIAYISADGIRWKKLREEPVITEGAFDSQNVAFWSESEGCYISYFRIFSEGFRSISRTMSKDFLNWSKPVEMDYGDTPREHLYTNQTHPYFRAPHIYISIPMRFMPGRKVLTDAQAKSLGVIGKYKGDCAEAVFMTSRGSNKYDRTFMEGFIRPGTDIGNWSSRAGMTALGVVPTGPLELSIYKQAHYAQPTAHLIRYTLRTDGFASVNAPYSGGEMVTKPFTFEGRELVVNFATSAAGFIKVEIQDEAGKPVSGYSINDAEETIGDDIERVISWKKGSDVSTLAGKTVRLRFLMKDADIYSIQFRK